MGQNNLTMRADTHEAAKEYGNPLERRWTDRTRSSAVKHEGLPFRHPHQHSLFDWIVYLCQLCMSIQHFQKLACLLWQ